VVPEGGWGEGTPIIPAKVLQIAWDDRFVLARQQELERRSPDDPNDTYMEPAPGKFHLWILDTSAPEVYGPMTQEEFKEMRKRLSISAELVLTDIYEFSPNQ